MRGEAGRLWQMFVHIVSDGQMSKTGRSAYSPHADWPNSMITMREATPMV